MLSFIALLLISGCLVDRKQRGTEVDPQLLASLHPDLFLRKAVDAFRAALTAEGCRVNMDVYEQHDQGPLAKHADADALLIVNPASVHLTAGSKQAPAHSAAR